MKEKLSALFKEAKERKDDIFCIYHDKGEGVRIYAGGDDKVLASAIVLFMNETPKNAEIIETAVEVYRSKDNLDICMQNMLDSLTKLRETLMECMEEVDKPKPQPKPRRGERRKKSNQ